MKIEVTGILYPEAWEMDRETERVTGRFHPHTGGVVQIDSVVIQRDDPPETWNLVDGMQATMTLTTREQHEPR